MRLAANGCNDLFAERFSLDVGDVKRAAFAITVNQCHNCMLFRFLLRIGTVFRLAANEGFVALDYLVVPADRAWRRFLQRCANAMAKKPSGFLAHTQHAANLKGAHALLRCHYEMRCSKPLV